MAFVKLVVVKTQFEGNKGECGKTKVNCCSKVNRGIIVNDKNNTSTNNDSDAIKTNDNSENFLLAPSFYNLITTSKKSIDSNDMKLQHTNAEHFHGLADTRTNPIVKESPPRIATCPLHYLVRHDLKFGESQNTAKR